jgi:hypothetical protein
MEGRDVVCSFIRWVICVRRETEGTGCEILITGLQVARDEGIKMSVASINPLKQFRDLIQCIDWMLSVRLSDGRHERDWEPFSLCHDRISMEEFQQWVVRLFFQLCNLSVHYFQFRPDDHFETAKLPEGIMDDFPEVAEGRGGQAER